MRSFFIGAALSLAALGCGQKGPLYLSDNPPPGVKPPARDYEPVPYPKELQGPERDSVLEK